MNGLVNLTEILLPSDFAAQGEDDVQWRYELNRDAIARRKANLGDLEEPEGRFFLSFTWHHLMDVIGRHTKNVATTRLSKKKSCFMLSENENTVSLSLSL